MDGICEFLKIWFLAILTLLTFLGGSGVALTPDGIALLEFKDALTVSSPLLQNWKASDVSPCSWGGINCTSSGNVQNITLSAQVPNLEGNISPSVGKLKSLRRLMLHENSLTGSIPPEIGSLSSLMTLSLYNNKLSGEIPPQLGTCSNLVELWLDGNMLSGTFPEALAYLKNLSSIFLGTNPPFLNSLDAISNVFGDNDISGSVPLAIFKNMNLKSFDASGNNLTGDITQALEELSKHPNIEWISIEANSFTGILSPSIGNAITLRNLNLGGQNGRGLEGPIPNEVTKLVNLDFFELSSNNLTGEIPPEIGTRMTSLTYLGLAINKLNGNIPSTLGNLVNLKSIYLQDNNLTGEIPASLTSINNLQNLNFGLNIHLTGPIPTDLPKLTALEAILLSNTSMSGPIPEDLGRFMPNLTTIDISDSFFQGTLPDGLCQGNHLKHIIGLGNQLEGAIPSSLSSCKSLIRVRLEDNKFTSIPDGFGSDSSLVYLGLSRNKLTGQLPKALGTNSELTNLDLSENELTGDISILEFSQLAKNLSVLNLAKNKITGKIPKSMGMCKLLFLIDLSYNSLTEAVPLELANLSSLQKLHLQGNNLTGLDPSMYSSWATSLLHLNLAENSWNAPIATETGSLTVLQNLNLSHGGLTGSIPSQLGKLAQLETLDLSHNNLTGEVPHELGELMKSLTIVNISHNRLTGSLPPAWLPLLISNPDCFTGNPDLCLEYNTSTKQCITISLVTKTKISPKIIVATTLGGALTISTIVAFLFYWFGRTKIPNKKSAPELDNIIVKNLTNSPLPFTFEEIMTATENLNDAYIIGRGGHGVVYKVTSASCSTTIAVKKIESDLDIAKAALVQKSFWSEIETVGNTKHRNLVRLLGFMKWEKVGLLLYEYVSNGDLHSALHGREVVEGVERVGLSWMERLRVARGVACGLAYLHHDYDPPIVHRDVKSSNVLLDDDFEPRISDFGLAKVLLASIVEPWLSSTNVLGTYGYIAPEVGYGAPVTPKVDIYSFGVLLLELLTGRQPVDASYGEAWHVGVWVKEIVFQNEGKVIDSVLDPLLLNNTNLTIKDEMLVVLRISLLCIAENPNDRPTMRDIVNLLTNPSQKIKRWNKNVYIKVGETSSSTDPTKLCFP